MNVERAKAYVDEYVANVRVRQADAATALDVLDDGEKMELYRRVSQHLAANEPWRARMEVKVALDNGGLCPR